VSEIEVMNSSDATALTLSSTMYQSLECHTQPHSTSSHSIHSFLLYLLHQYFQRLLQKPFHRNIPPRIQTSQSFSNLLLFIAKIKQS
jgi:hypothetical protein